MQIKDFPLLSLPDEQLRGAGSSEMMLAETKQFLRQLFNTANKQEEVLEPFGVYIDMYIEDDGYTTMTAWQTPSLSPQDIIRKNRFVAEHGMFKDKTTADDAEYKARGYFINYARWLIDRYGTEPTGQEQALDYMLQGAMPHYDPNKTISQNAKQFEFDRAQKKLVKPQNDPQSSDQTPDTWAPYPTYPKLD